MSCENERSPLLPSFENYNEPKHIIIQVTKVKDPRHYEPIMADDYFFEALNLDELLQYKTDPWWQFVRRIAFLTFWIVLVLILFIALLLAYIRTLSGCTILSNSSINMATTSRMPIEFLDPISVIQSSEMFP